MKLRYGIKSDTGLLVKIQINVDICNKELNRET